MMHAFLWVYSWQMKVPIKMMVICEVPDNFLNDTSGDQKKCSAWTNLASLRIFFAEIEKSSS